MKQATPEQIVTFLMGGVGMDIVKRLETTMVGSPILCREAAMYIKQLRSLLHSALPHAESAGDDTLITLIRPHLK